MSDDGDDWAAQRREAAAAGAERAERARAADVAAARELVAAFVDDARAAGIPTAELLVRAGEGPSTYRCGLTGWYLRRDGSLAIAEDGEMYVLTAPKSLRARLSGVHLEPTEPRTQAGIGARDGESIALDALLRLRLHAGSDWPIVR